MSYISFVQILFILFLSLECLTCLIFIPDPISSHSCLTKKIVFFANSYVSILVKIPFKCHHILMEIILDHSK